MTYLRANDRDEVRRQKITFDRMNETNSRFMEFSRKNLRLSRDSRILDLGCGAGRFTMLLSQRFGCSIEGWDDNARFIKSARRGSFGKGTRSGNVTYRQMGFFERIPDEYRARFNAIVFREVLMCVDDPAALIQWAKPLLRPNGRFLAIEPDYGMTTIYPEIPHWREFMERYGRYASEHHEDYSFGRRLLDIYRKCRFCNISVQPFVEVHTAVDGKRLKAFMRAEAMSIKQDMPRFIQETGFCQKKIDDILNKIETLHLAPGAFVQTHMVGICGQTK